MLRADGYPGKGLLTIIDGATNKINQSIELDQYPSSITLNQRQV